MRSRRLFTDPVKDEEDRELEAVEPREAPNRLLLTKELNKQLDICIDKLSKNQKSCFVLRYKNNIGISDIAKTLKCSESTVKVHLFRAIKNLQAYLLPYLEGGDKHA